MNKISRIFDRAVVDENRLHVIDAMPEPRKRYVIAMTPRSGSSYLCDVMKKTRRFGKPDEVLNQELIPALISKHPGRTPDEYLRNILRVKKTPNRVSGFKASWFQFENFTQAMNGGGYLAGFKYIYLTRRDLAAQAVSLYKATGSSVFHTNVQHREEALGKLASLEYSFDGINEWYEHIASQEKGWRKYFFKNRIFPLCITHEEIEEAILGVLKRIAAFVGVSPGKVTMPKAPSIFKKIGDARNIEWAHRFAWERARQAHGIPADDAASENPKAAKRR